MPGSGEQDFRTDGGVLLDNDPAHRDELAEEARGLLAEAGYADARDLGELEYLYVDEGNGAAVARAGRRLGERPGPPGDGPRRQPGRAGHRPAGGDLHPGRNGDPGFGQRCGVLLMRWGSGKPENLGKYANSAYDTLLSVIAGAEEGEARMGCLHDAEALLLEEGAVAPLYTSVTGWTLRDGFSGVLRTPGGGSASQPLAGPPEMSRRRRPEGAVFFVPRRAASAADSRHKTC